MVKQKTIAILFSGGLDSTYMAWKALKDGHKVKLFYVNIENNEQKGKVELNQAKKIVKEFNTQFPHYTRLEEVVKVDVRYNGQNIHLTQMPIWILGIQYLISVEIDEIQIGYVMNDDALSYIDDFKRIYRSYRPIVDHLPKLTFPLIKMKKRTMMSELPSKIRELVVSCEYPYIPEDVNDYRECGNCEPCKRAKQDHVFYDRKANQPAGEYAVGLGGQPSDDRPNWYGSEISDSLEEHLIEKAKAEGTILGSVKELSVDEEIKETYPEV